MKKALSILFVLYTYVCAVTTLEDLLYGFSNGLKYAGNPIVKHIAATWKARQVHYPYVIANPWQPDSLLIYFGGGDYTQNNFNIGVASAPKTSLVTWTEYASNPLLTFPTSGGSPQAYQAVGPHLVYFDTDSNKIFMHATCFNNGATQSWQGRFSSTNGYTFTYLGAVLQASGDETVLGDAGYLRDGNNWYAYYTYRTATATLPGIRLATSTDCINWTKTGTQILLIGEDGSYDSKYIEGCQALKLGNKYVLLYSCYNGTTSSNGNWVSAVASSDLYNGPFAKEVQPVLTKSLIGWDSTYIATAHLSGDYVFYQGTKSGGDYNAALWDMGVFKLGTTTSDNSKPTNPVGVSYYVKQVIKKTVINDTYQNLMIPIKIPRTGKVLSNCDSSKHVVVYNKEGTKIPRRVVFTSDTVYVYTNYSVNCKSDTSLFVGFGKTLNESNSALAFSNSGISDFWGFDSSGTSGRDYVGSLHQTITAPDTQNSSTSKFKGALYSATNGKSTCNVQPLSNVTAFTLSVWVYNTANGTQMVFTNRNTSQPYVQLYIYNVNTLIIHVGGSSTSFSATYPVMPLNSWTHLSVVYDGSKSDNFGRLKLYVNGFLSTGNYAGTIPASVPVFTGGYTSIGSIDGTPTYAMAGYIDNVELSIGIARPQTYIADQYMLQRDLVYGIQSYPQSNTIGNRKSSISTNLKLW